VFFVQRPRQALHMAPIFFGRTQRRDWVQISIFKNCLSIVFEEWRQCSSDFRLMICGQLFIVADCKKRGVWKDWHYGFFSEEEWTIDLMGFEERGIWG
jgi:hypothetical protein